VRSRGLGAEPPDDAGKRCLFLCHSARLETPRLCRGGSKGLTFTAVAHRRNF
jgi:hypothetical protein